MMTGSLNATSERRVTTPDARIGRAVLLLLAAGLLVIVIVLLVGGERNKSSYYVPAGCLILTGVGLTLRGGRQAAAAVLLSSLAPLPWAAAAGVNWLARVQVTREQEARRNYSVSQGVAFDSRSPKQVVEDLRAEGRDAWPATHPAMFLRRGDRGSASLLRGADGGELQPLGGIANVDTVSGNEAGRYLIYASDEHGFHNPPGIWALPQIDVAAVGDSYAQGSSVPSDRNLVAVVRRRWHATLNLGYAGNGPLIELATLLEYLPQRRPKVVLWMVCEANDIGEDLNRELASSLLQAYWKELRSLQSLEDRQPEIDKLLRGHVEKARLAMSDPNVGTSPLGLISLEGLRVAAYSLTKPPTDRWDIFAAIVGAASDVVRGWGSQLYLVYLPVHFSIHESWLTARQRGAPEQRRQHVLEIGRKLGIPIIDLETVFENAGPQLNAFIYPYRAHFTATGYEALGGALVTRLEDGGIRP